MTDLSWSINLEETASIGSIARKVMSYGTTTRNYDGNEMYITHPICSTDTLQGIALKYGVTMEHLRRVNRLWASDSMHLRKFLLIPIPAPLDSTVTRSRSESNGIGNGVVGTPDSQGFRNSNYPAGSRENPLSRSEALALLKTYETDAAKDQRPGTPESSSSSEINGTASVPPDKSLSPSDFFSRLDQNIATCRKSTEQTAVSWSARSYSVEDGDKRQNGIKASSNGVTRSPSWGRVVRARKPNPELQLEGVDNMVFEL
ncbi:lysM and putative peptidoglycan-binding domain-containing protein 2-like isoform X2 [Paramacrobiotus metropolitanus]|uniref:lysM and putative peptidoglycan-binding domain-containing protein 2-like isoform X2 n=1 Tax=Paramacrobiotus metropolitanus TaxID=2943436 RepID=UPI0024461730|nr:lysM and putative peptidoglycan-binding domain-containing protein 2-like isoform X2 [Paramacrobiotus metropolitanus]